MLCVSSEALFPTQVLLSVPLKISDDELSPDGTQVTFHTHGLCPAVCGSFVEVWDLFYFSLIRVTRTDRFICSACLRAMWEEAQLICPW